MSSGDEKVPLRLSVALSFLTELPSILQSNYPGSRPIAGRVELWWRRVSLVNVSSF